MPCGFYGVKGRQIRFLIYGVCITVIMLTPFHPTDAKI
jgi:hypothetical protein